jgi:hypothetical protein
MATLLAAGLIFLLALVLVSSFLLAGFLWGWL